MRLFPCQNLMASSFEEQVENGKHIRLYTCKSGNVSFKVCGDAPNILYDVIEKTCRQKCPAMKEIK